MAQLVEQLLPTPEIRGLNPVIGKLYIKLSILLKSRKITKKRPGMAHVVKTSLKGIKTQTKQFG